MYMHKTLLPLAAMVAAACGSWGIAEAAYVRATSTPVTVTQIYSNEFGSPFVYVSSPVNPACQGGIGLYLYDITQSPGNAQYRNNKMAIVLAAMAAGQQVTLDYYYDNTVVGWSACYIEGVTLLN